METDQRINNLKLHPVTGKEDDSFVGLRITGNDINLYYPETYDISEETKALRLEIVALIKSIKLAKTNSDAPSSLFSSANVSSEFALDSYLWMINDYLTHGFYINSEKMFAQTTNGKINWKRTLQTQPLVAKNGNVIYLDMISEVKNPADNLIVEIHKYCVKKSIDYIGWLFNLSSASIHVPPFSEIKKKEYLVALNAELEKTFDDDKKLRLNHMANIVKGLDADAKLTDFTYGVDNYHYVYERMVDYVFGGQTDIQDFYPNGEWRLVHFPGKVFDSSNLRPDTILLKSQDSGNDAYVLDSKFYRFGTTGLVSDLPETTSIQKQITYGDFIKTNAGFPIRNVYSAFILPYNKKEGPYKSDQDLQFIGMASSTWKSDKQSHNTIYAFLIDLKRLVMSWYKHINLEMSENLVTQIAEIINDQVQN
jgi:hypothetical protein